jgi:hypothetical protein
VGPVVGPVGVVRGCARVVLSGVRRRGSVLRKSLSAVFEVLCLCLRRGSPSSRPPVLAPPQNRGLVEIRREDP